MSESKPLLFSWVATRHVGICHLASRTQDCRGEWHRARTIDARCCVAKEWKHMLSIACVPVIHSPMLAGVSEMVITKTAAGEPIYPSPIEGKSCP